jgi:hypothetical protein
MINMNIYNEKPVMPSIRISAIIVFAVLLASLLSVAFGQLCKVRHIIDVSHSPDAAVRPMAIRDMSESWGLLSPFYLKRLISMADEDENPWVIRDALLTIEQIEPSNDKLANLATKYLDAKNSHLQSTCCGLFADMKILPQEVSNKLIAKLSINYDPVVRIASARSLYTHNLINRAEYKKVVLESLVLSESQKNREAKVICERVLSGLE